MRIFNTILKFGKNLIKAWDEDKPARLAAGLAYYSLFSLVPLLFIAISVAGFFLDEVLLTEQLFTRIAVILGPEAANAFESALTSLSQSTTGGSIITTIIGVIALLFAASGLFANLKYALNSIWQVPPSEYAGVMAFIKTRLLAFLIVIGFGMLLVVVAFAGMIISTLNAVLRLEIISSTISFLAIYTLAIFTFALFYKILPDTHVRWRDVWGGAIFAVTILGIGLWLVATFLGAVNLSSATEAAGAMAVVLVAVYYSTQIFLIGSEFTKVYAYMYGSKVNIEPNKYLDRDPIPTEEDDVVKTDE